MFLVCTFFTNWKSKHVEFQLWFFLYQRNFDQNQNLLLLDINKEIIIRYFIEIYDVNKTQVLGWDTYWNLPHLPDLTGSSPCPYRAGGTGGTWGHPPHALIFPDLWTKPVTPKDLLKVGYSRKNNGINSIAQKMCCVLS